MALFKKQKKEETKEYKEQYEEASKTTPEIDLVKITTKNKPKEEVKEEAKQPSLLDIVITMPDVEYKAQILALLSEIVQRLIEEQEEENADK